jgi:hypothetical protein
MKRSHPEDGTMIPSIASQQPCTGQLAFPFMTFAMTMLLSSDRDFSAFPALQVRNPLHPDA